jgi:succinyl-CoA synthetase beta subunit
MDIEDVAKEHPEEIRKFVIDFNKGMTKELALEICRYLKIIEGA